MNPLAKQLAKENRAMLGYVRSAALALERLANAFDSQAEAAALKDRAAAVFMFFGRPHVCSICRGYHGPEIEHAGE